MRKLVQLITKEISGLHEAAYLLGFSALFSQVLALVRDRLFASQFGAGAVLDVYYASFRVPDLVFAIVSSMVSVSVLAPFLAKKMAENDGETRKFLNSIFTLFSLSITLICGLLYILMPMIASYAFKGLEDGNLFVSLTRILLLSPIFLGISNIFASIIQLKNRFVLSAISPILYNIGIICGIIFFFPIWGIHGLIYGVVLGTFLHAMIQAPFIFKERLMPRLTLSIDFSQIKDVIKLALPRSFTLATGQLTMFFLISFASLMATGSIAIFSLSLNLQAIPLAIIGASYSIAVFVKLSKLHASGMYDEFLQKTKETARHILFWSTPVVAIFIILKTEIVRIFFGYGEFGSGDINLTAMSLAIFSIAIVPQGLNLLIVRAMYAEGKTFKPFTVNVISSIAIIATAYMAVRYLKSSQSISESLGNFLGLTDTDFSVLVLPMAFSVGLVINMMLLMRTFNNDHPTFTASIGRSFKKIFGATVICGYASYMILNKLEKWINAESIIGLLSITILTTVVAGLVYLISLKAMKSEELIEVFSTLKQKAGKGNIVVNDKNLVVDELV